jgi:hypothetical protein
MGAATDGLKLQSVAIVTETAAAVVTDDALVVSLAGAFGFAGAAPGFPAMCAALVVACQHVCHDRGQTVAYYAGDYVFTFEDGRPPHPDTIRQRFDRLAAAAGLSRITFHDLRHSYAAAR